MTAHWSRGSEQVMEIMYSLTSHLVSVCHNESLLVRTDGADAEIIYTAVSHLVRVCDDECALVREVVVDVGDDLHSNVSLACAGRSHHHGQTRLHPRLDGLHLSGREGNGVPRDTQTTQS